MSGSAFFAGDEWAAADANVVDLRKPACCIVKASGTPAVSIPTAGGPVAMNVDILNPQSWHSVVTNNTRITPTIHGFYRITGNVQFAGGTGGTNPRRGAAIRVNGATLYYGQVIPASAGAVNLGAQVTVDGLELNGSTDYIELFGFQDSGSTINIGDYGSTRLSLWLGYDASF